MKIRIINVLKIIWIPLAIIWLGALLNIVVVGANSGMPAVGLDFTSRLWVPLTAETRFAFLGDIIPLFGYQCSIGDIVMRIGAAIYLFKAILYIYRGIRDLKVRRFSWY